MKTKWSRRAAALLTAAVAAVSLLTSTAFAISKESTVSSWAREEVEEAEAVELFVHDTQMDYTAPISRVNFASIANNYVAVQSNCSPVLLEELMRLYELEKDENGKLVNPFTDKDQMPLDTSAIIAHKLGIVMGDEKGAFNYNKNITRAEAAAMLIRAYQACGGELPEEAAEITFADGNQIPEWAREGASALAVWGVMKGDEKGNFSPNKPCTYEHAILMFLRLYKNAPVSRVNGNVKARFTYEQCLEILQGRTVPEFCQATLQVEGNGVTLIRHDIGGMMHSYSNLYFVYRDGGVRFFNLGIDPGVVIKDAAFSEDGKTFTCTLVAESDVADPVLGVTLKAGSYRATVNTETLECEVIPMG